MDTKQVLLTPQGPGVRIKLIQADDLDGLPSRVTRHHGPGTGKSGLPVKMTWFVSSRDEAKRLRPALESNRELSQIPVTILVQPPLCNCNTLVQLWCIDELPVKKRHGDNCMAIELQNGDQWLFAGQNPDQGKAGFERSVQGSFETLFNNLARFGFSYYHLLRTWFFIPGITGVYQQKERYQIFNKCRKGQFTKHAGPDRPLSFYPASTGIGTNNNGVLASAVAFKPNTPVSVFMMDNDCQVPAYHYPARESVEPPLFLRGLCLGFEKSAMIFVSGTASILNAGTVHENDISAQTRQTIENIFNLLVRNVPGHPPALPADTGNLVKCATVYIRHAKDYPTVKDICRNAFGDIPIIYVKADICRSNLLVEIECIATRCDV